MNFPSIINGVFQSYRSNDSTEVPLEDIDSFILVHEIDKNGLQVQAIIKKELVTRYISKYSDEKIIAKYPIFCGNLTIRAKDMKKFRKEIYTELQKQPTQTRTYGINGGTPIAQSMTFSYKEIKTNKGDKQ